MTTPSLANPYEQHRQFVNRKQVIEEIEAWLNRNRSCAIIGGEGMGKTAVLQHLQQMFAGVAQPTRSRFIPIYFDAASRNIDSLRNICRQLIDATLPQTKDWLTKCAPNVPEIEREFDELSRPGSMMTQSGKLDESEACAAFKEDLCSIINVVLSTVSNTKLLFLLDNMFLLRGGYRNAFVRHWLQLLGGDLNSHLAVVVTCLKDFFDQFELLDADPSTGLLPGCGNIVPIYLHVLERTDSHEVVKCPVRETLDLELADDVADEIYRYTGGYPLLLQNTMQYLWYDASTGRPINTAYVRDSKPDWAKACHAERRWIQDMITGQHPLLSPVTGLLVTSDETWEFTSLREAVESCPVGLRHGQHLREVLYMLISWGVVRKVGEKAYCVSGELIREWLEPFTGRKPKEQEMEEYVDFELLIDSNGHVRSHSEEGDANADTSTNIPNHIRLCADLIERNQTNEALSKEFGQELYDLLFPSSIHVLLQKTEAVARRTNRNLRLRLNIEPDSLASLPLEFAYRGEGDYFLANNPKTVLSRYLDVHLPRSRARRAEDPLHLLAIIANPSDQTPLDPNRWENIIRQALDTPIRAGKIKLHTVKQATFRNIRDALLQQKPSIIQFVGHGMYQDGKGYLALVDGETGATWQVDDEAFAGLLLGFDDYLGLVSLATCESAKSDSPRGFLGIAPKIVQRGVPAVVAMQYNVLIKTAEIFLENFYTSISARKPVDWAVQWARNAVSIEMGRGNREFATPVLYMRAKDGEVF